MIIYVGWVYSTDETFAKQLRYATKPELVAALRTLTARSQIIGNRVRIEQIRQRLKEVA